MSVVELSEAKAHLNIERDDQNNEVQSALDAAEAVVAKRVGPLEPTVATERVRGCASSLVLNSLPAVSLTSVTPIGGTALDVSDLYVSPGGIVEYVESATWFGARAYTVVYQAGHNPLPADLRQAVLEMTRHLWQTQRGGGTRPGSPPSTELSNTLPGSATALPFRVAQLLARYELPGFA